MKNQTVPRAPLSTIIGRLWPLGIAAIRRPCTAAARSSCMRRRKRSTINQNRPTTAGRRSDASLPRTVEEHFLDIPAQPRVDEQIQQQEHARQADHRLARRPLPRQEFANDQRRHERLDDERKSEAAPPGCRRSIGPGQGEEPAEGIEQDQLAASGRQACSNSQTMHAKPRDMDQPDRENAHQQRRSEARPILHVGGVELFSARHHVPTRVVRRRSGPRTAPPKGMTKYSVRNRPTAVPNMRWLNRRIQRR